MHLALSIAFEVMAVLAFTGIPKIIRSIGKPREPVTHNEAVWNVFIAVALTAILTQGAYYLDPHALFG